MTLRRLLGDRPHEPRMVVAEAVFTAMPASASRYFLPASSHSHTPSPRTNATGWRA